MVLIYLRAFSSKADKPEVAVVANVIQTLTGKSTLNAQIYSDTHNKALCELNKLESILKMLVKEAQSYPCKMNGAQNISVYVDNNLLVWDWNILKTEHKSSCFRWSTVLSLVKVFGEVWPGSQFDVKEGGILSSAVTAAAKEYITELSESQHEYEKF